MRIGDWVRQSSFHFKAFYNDFLRGFGEVGYKVYELMIADRQPFWNRVGYVDESRARCFPDGFPCAVYLNGTFYGVFAWQLKKSRKNMNMKKYEVAFNRASTPNHQSTAIIMANSKEEARAKFLRGNPNCKVVAVYEKK